MINTLKAVGKFTNFRMSHEIQDRNNETVKYYKADLEVKRLSDVCDYIPLVISSKVLGDTDAESMEYARVEGVLRTRNYIGHDNRSHLSVYVKVVDLAPADSEEPMKNEVVFEGIVCKMPTLRETTSGRLISDLLLAHNNRSKRGYRTKSYYIPALIWGSSAKTAHKQIKVGDDVMLSGRLQSRKYHCKDDAPDVIHWAYEISVDDFQLLDTEDKSDNVA